MSPLRSCQTLWRFHPVISFRLNRHTGFRYMAFTQFLRRNFVSISFPTVTAILIFLDWNHTRKWKTLKQK